MGRRPASPMRLRRKRQRGKLTPQACKECRQKRTKCNGQMPCERCSKQHVECSYQLIEHPSKADLRAEIDSLRRKIEALIRPGELEAGLARTDLNAAPENASSSVESGLLQVDVKPESANQHDMQLSKLAATEAVRSLEGDIALGNSSPAIASHKSATELQSLLSDGKPDRGKKKNSSVDGNYRTLPLRTGLSATLETWTVVTDNMESTRHLLALYFCWEYPNFAPISKEHFLRDFHARNERYCSTLLVNALLSLGCQLSDRFCEAELETVCLSGDEFFEEARRLLPFAADHNPLTTIQALGIMSLREACGGRVIQSRHYAEQAMLLVTETGLHTIFDEHHPERDVFSKAFWGTFMLNHTWSLTAGVLPHCTRSLKLPPKPAIISVLEQSPWAPYISGYAELQPHVQLSNVRSVYGCFCRLTELVHQVLYYLHIPGQKPTGSALLSIYQKCLYWYDQLPQIMKLGHNSTPAVMFIHLYYHYFILLLFRKFTKMRILGSPLSTRDICDQSARAILALVESYASLYTLRRVPTFLPYFLFAAAYVYFDSCPALTDRPAVPHEQDSEMMRQSIEALEKMVPHHKIAKHALTILYDTSSERRMNLHLDGTRAPFPSSSLGRELQDCVRRHDSNASGRIAQISRKKEIDAFGLVWLQHTVPVGNRDQMEEAGFASL